MKALLITTAIITTIVGLTAACTTSNKDNVIGASYNNTEIPDYTLVEKAGDIQIRQYPQMLLAQTTVSGDRSSAANAGFKILANYIFGDNTTPAGNTDKIAMTAPVTQSPAQTSSSKIAMTSPVTMQPNNDSWLVTFKMPRKYNLETLPKPNDERINIVTEPAKKIAAIQFSGLMTNDKIQQHYQQLITFLKENNYKYEDSYQTAAYDNPYSTLPWNRRNEILVALQD